jgi:spore maturation protein CgeB
LRDIEAPMLGACYLTEWTEGLSRLYQLGTEVETYRTADELSAKLHDLTGDPSRRQSMRHAARRRALAEHSLTRTMSKIEEIVA